MDRAECPWILLGLRMVMGIFCEIMQKSHLFCHFHVQKMMARGSCSLHRLIALGLIIEINPTQQLITAVSKSRACVLFGLLTFINSAPIIS